MRPAVNLDGALGAPTVGTWHPDLGLGGPLRPGERIGVLVQAGRSVVVCAPRTAVGVAVHVAAPGTWMAYGDVLVEEGEASGALSIRQAAPRKSAEVPDDVTVVEADTDGTIYLRSDPASPAFAPQGAEVSPLDTVALVEVMKTFTPVRTPVGGTVVRVCVEDGAPVASGDALLWVR